MAAEPVQIPLRLGFAGTPGFAATVLEGLIGAGVGPVVVYTQPDRPSGRGRRLQPPPVKALALEHDLPVRQPPSLRGRDAAEELATWNLDVLVVAAYGLILPPAILAVPRYGCINVHASLLPRWRGAAPVERAILAGDKETGVSIMQMDQGLDTGPVYLRKRCPIEPHMDGPALEGRLAQLGVEALLECLARLPELRLEAQDEAGATYAPKLTRADAVIDWSDPAIHIERQVRALRDRLPAGTQTGEVRVTVLEAEAVEDDGGSDESAPPGTVAAASAAGIRIVCGEGALVISQLQLNVGKGKPLRAADAVNGYSALFTPGAVLGTGVSS